MDTNGLLTSIRNRQKLYLKKQKCPFNDNLKQHYIKYRLLLNALIQLARSKYYSHQILLSKYNMKSTWKLINEAIYSTKKSGTPINCI